ncbi:MAG TPA: biotin/lipoyl-containing protein [Candidatus Limnocylindrales bacterium]|nr:biotin/lipoyl-containing protein [Candidatus Limnocylindrales bacterium]
MTRRVRVVPAPASLMPGDRSIVVAPDDPAEVVVEPFGDGRAVVHGPDGTDRWAYLGSANRLPDGRSVVEVVVDGWRFELELEDDHRATLRERATRARDASASTGPLEVRAAIPGRVAAVTVTHGDEIEAGATLLVVEAMKMQNELRAPRAGRVERVAIGAGETIEVGDVLVVIA